jgi:LAO/AO transport system kinase
VNTASLEALAEGVRHGNVRAIARAISAIENAVPGHEALLGALYRQTGHAAIVGLTGAPGAGKSSLVDGLVRLLRERGVTVGVLAVDPSSPFTGGSILGDRIRMQAHAPDAGVFIRSMSARGHLGGLAAAAGKAVHVLDAAGKDVVMVETVGVGQSELEIARTADTTIVVLTPAAGDMVQMLKAGILEIADIFVVNKADLEGADRLMRDLRTALNLGEHGDWIPPILQTRATEGSGLDAVWDAVEQHRAYLQSSGKLEQRRRERLQAEILDLALGRLRAQLLGTINGREQLDALVDRALRREIDPYDAADAVLSSSLTHSIGATGHDRSP